MKKKKTCKFCGKEIEGVRDYCDNRYCVLQNEIEKTKKLEEVKVFHDVFVKKSNKVFELFPSRPWTPACVDNLYYNMTKNWPAEKTSKETRRKIDEVKFMQNVINRVGYEKIKLALIKIEKTDDYDKELAFLKDIGILNFFKFQSKNKRAKTKEAINK
jgi:hypothetical protein